MKFAGKISASCRSSGGARWIIRHTEQKCITCMKYTSNRSLTRVCIGEKVHELISNEHKGVKSVRIFCKNEFEVYFLSAALTHLEVWAYYQNIARYQLVDSRYTSLLHCSRHRGDTAQTRWKFIRSRNGSLQNSRLTPTCHSLPFCNVWRFAQFSGCSSKRQSLTRSCQLLYVVRSQQRCLDAISILLRDG